MTLVDAPLASAPRMIGTPVVVDVLVSAEPTFADKLADVIWTAVAVEPPEFVTVSVKM